MPVSGFVNKQQFVDSAAEEMDSKLGYIYKLPLVPPNPDNLDPAPALLDYEVLILKHINNKLASGRLILAQDMAGEENSLHAYGLRLVTEATNELMALANGEVDLTAEKRYTIQREGDKVPSIINEDPESLLLGFTENVMQDHYGVGVRPPYYVRPGRPG
jgi:hypothetical protein